MEEGLVYAAGGTEEAWARIRSIQADTETVDKLCRRYDQWAELYDQDNATLHYNGPCLAAKYLAKQNLPKSALILDVAAGTGEVGKILSEEYGYHNLDALDGSARMLEKAKQRGIFKELYCCFIGGGATVPIADDSYDGAVISGAFARGHLKLDAMDEIIRIVKPGGYIVNVMRNENRKLVEYLDMDRVFAEKEERGEWQKVVEDTSHVYYLNFEALVQVYRVTKCELAHTK